MSSVRKVSLRTQPSLSLKDSIFHNTPGAKVPLKMQYYETSLSFEVIAMVDFPLELFYQPFLISTKFSALLSPVGKVSRTSFN